MKKNIIVRNISHSIINQLITIVCGFILPKLFLIYYGSKINGLVSSITQFLSFVTFLEMGIGAVVQSNLYKPLADCDLVLLSQIMKAARKFYRIIALAFCIYIGLLCIYYPYITRNSFAPLFTMMLIIIISISQFMQYYFGIANQILLNADQKAYIPLFLQSITLILNTLVCYLLMRMGFGIQAVKTGSAAIYLLRPVVMHFYVLKKYNLNYITETEEEPIKQKWNGVAQHIAAMVLEHTDVVVLTVFSTLENVSIYTVYYNVVCGIRRIFSTVIDSLRATFGRLIAKENYTALLNHFTKMEYIIHFLISIAFSCTISLIVPFVKVYTNGIDDANYIVPKFGLIITCAYLMYCLRCFYNMLILAAAHYKETQAASFTEAIINVIASVIFVKRFGLSGVAIGTFCAMTYRVIYLIQYLSKNIICRSVLQAYRHMATDAFIIIISCFLSSYFDMKSVSYVSWIILTFKVFSTSLIIALLVHICFYKDITMYYGKKLGKAVLNINEKK